MADSILTLRQLNRATLARQFLLQRASLSIPAALETLIALQAQLPISPYVALWTRLQNFQRDDLAAHIEAHSIVKATLMRGTLHLCTAADYPTLRATLQPVLVAAAADIAKRRDPSADTGKAIAAAKEFLAKGPRTFAEISAMLTELDPNSDVGTMRYAVRTHIPLIQVPNASRWSYPGNPQFALAESWLGQSVDAEADLPALILRYLAVFGPATVKDIETWSGLGNLKEAVDALRPQLRTYRDEKKRELFDLPDAPLPDADTPTPERFLPEFDNLLLSHQNRTRVLADQFRSKVYLPGLRVAATFLVDGFVAGVWKVGKSKGAATLRIQPFEELAPASRDALAAEAEALVRFIEPDAKTHTIDFAE